MHLFLVTGLVIKHVGENVRDGVFETDPTHVLLVDDLCDICFGEIFYIADDLLIQVMTHLGERGQCIKKSVI